MVPDGITVKQTHIDPVSVAHKSFIQHERSPSEVYLSPQKYTNLVRASPHFPSARGVFNVRSSQARHGQLSNTEEQRLLTLCHFFCTPIRPEWTNRGECLAAPNNAPFHFRERAWNTKCGGHVTLNISSLKGVTIKRPMWVDVSVCRSRAVNGERVTACLITTE